MSDTKYEKSAPLLNWPAAWGKERAAAVLFFATALFSAGAVISIPYTIEATQAGNGLRTLYGVGIGMVSITFILIAAPRLKVRRKTLPPNISVAPLGAGRTGLELPYLKYWKRTLLLWLIVGAVFLIVRGLLFLREPDDRARGPIRTVLNSGGLVTVAVALMVISLLLVYLFVGRGRKSGSLTLDKEGISQEIGRSRRAMGWDDIGSISACIVNNVHTVRITPRAGATIDVDTSRSLIDRMQAGLLARSIDVPAWVLGMDPALFYYTVRYYWQHPEARNELASDAVIDRIRRGDLDVQP